ncbi:MAG: DUF1844 domain-containing protein [Planctomycetota bacterium]
MSEQEHAGKIHIDSDWKTEAAKEKERLAQEETVRPSGPRGPVQASFLELVDLLVMQVAVALGGYAGPGGERIPPNLAAAQHFIDILTVLEQKTKGNLTDEEKRAMDTVLYELRMQFVEMTGRLQRSPESAANTTNP